MSKLEIYVKDVLVETIDNGYDMEVMVTTVSYNLNTHPDGRVTYDFEVYAFGDELYSSVTHDELEFSDVELRWIDA
jgi:hypothetical protein